MQSSFAVERLEAGLYVYIEAAGTVDVAHTLRHVYLNPAEHVDEGREAVVVHYHVVKYRLAEVVRDGRAHEVLSAVGEGVVELLRAVARYHDARVARQREHPDVLVVDVDRYEEYCVGTSRTVDVVFAHEQDVEFALAFEGVV